MERAQGILVFLIGAAIYWQGRYLPMGSLRTPGPGFFPNVIAFTMMILSLFLIIPKTKKSQGSRFPGSIHNILLMFLVLVAYSFVLEYLGFVAVSLLLMIFLFKAGGAPRWVNAVTWAFISVGFSYLLFEVMLGGNLPRGIFGA